MSKKIDGFTLIELIFVIAILVIIAPITVPSLIGFINKAEKSLCATNRKTFEKLYSTFRLEN